MDNIHLPLSSVSTEAFTLNFTHIYFCDLEHQVFIFSLSYQWVEQEDSLTVLTNLDVNDRTGNVDWHAAILRLPK